MSAVPQTQERFISPVEETRSEQQYADTVNPQWMRLVKLLQMNVHYERCLGAELFTSGGRRILDFLSGYCVHNLGHNHPAIIQAIKDELDRARPRNAPVPRARAGWRACSTIVFAGGRQGDESRKTRSLTDFVLE